jgi:membrane protease YdiL (CAAX protease family)
LHALDFENPWISEIDSAARPLPVWAAFFITILAVAAGLGLASFLAARAHGAAVAFVLLNLVMFGVLWAAALGAGLFEGRRIWPAGDRPLLAASAAFLTGVGGISIAVGLSGMLGGVSKGDQAFGGALAVAGGLALTGFQAGAEEALFRGWLQPLLGARAGPWVGLCATALLFAALHMAVGERGLLPMINLVTAGLFFGLLAWRTGGMWAPAAAHLGWNWTESAILGLTPNPGVSPLGSLFDLDCVGRGVWSGGAEAMNGALTTTLSLVILTAALAAWPCRRIDPSGSVRLAVRQYDFVP